MKSDRYFELIQILRRARRPLTADHLAAELEVTVRTIYRDMAALQAMRVPIEGAPGVGYVMRRGFDLPPLNFTAQEVEAISVSLALLQRTGDKGLMRAAKSITRKISDATGHTAAQDSFRVSTYGAKPPPHVDLEFLRDAMRNAMRLHLVYEDEKHHVSSRTILPVAIFYYVEATLLAAWCELREDFRHFRVDRMQACSPAGGTFKDQAEVLRREWNRLQGPE